MKKSFYLPRLEPSRLRLATVSLLVGASALWGCESPQAVPQESFVVSLEQARHAAERLSNSYVPAQATPMREVASHFVLRAANRPALYAFNYQGGGFSIIAADKHLMPVLAYSANGNYTNTNKPEGLQAWEQKTGLLVADASKLAEQPSATILAEWDAILTNSTCLPVPEEAVPTPRPPTETNATGAAPAAVTTTTSSQCVPVDTYVSTTTVAPLVPVTWGQGCTYNNLCPPRNACGGRAFTGCVPTAMAQIMRYWRHPASYDWNSMPAGSGNGEVQRLMVDAGSSLPSIDYGDDGTGARTEQVADRGNSSGLYNYRFGYRSARHVNYDYGTVLNNLNSRQPVILRGYGDRTNRFLGVIYSHSNGHAWVCDGYQQTNYVGYSFLMFHMNWGWHEEFSSAGNGPGGDYNGWYQFNNWNIPGLNLNFQYANAAIVDIRP